jgi:acyl-coenzyme A thioesterase PaaI-like protein
MVRDDDGLRCVGECLHRERKQHVGAAEAIRGMQPPLPATPLPLQPLCSATAPQQTRGCAAQAGGAALVCRAAGASAAAGPAAPGSSAVRTLRGKPPTMTATSTPLHASSTSVVASTPEVMEQQQQG